MLSLLSDFNCEAKLSDLVDFRMKHEETCMDTETDALCSLDIPEVTDSASFCKRPCSRKICGLHEKDPCLPRANGFY